MWNVRICKTFTCIGIPKHWRLFLFWYETFITFLTFRFFDTRRDTISTMLIVPSHPTTRGRPIVHNWTSLAQIQKSARFVQLQISTHSFFQKSPKILSPSLPGMTSFTSPVVFSIRGFYYDISDCHILPARAWTPTLNVCLYPCTKPNTSKPN